jgi:hypothetical protein
MPSSCVSCLPGFAIGQQDQNLLFARCQIEFRMWLPQARTVFERKNTSVSEPSLDPS